jgi:hypothetical protein
MELKMHLEINKNTNERKESQMMNTNHHHFSQLNKENAKRFPDQLNLKLKKR